MSFFRNIRSTITRGKSSSRDTTPVRTTSTSSRPGSIVSNATGGRRDSIESRTDSLFNRSETFILNSDQEDKQHSNTSTLEKKSKKSKVLSKFSTFTKRKKTPSPTENAASEHHPPDNATNTYYKWKSEGPSTLDYDAQSDPFNFLYEQHSSLKSLHNGSTSSAESTSGRGSTTGSLFDSSTYRKGKMPSQLKEQLHQLKTHTHTNPDLHEAEEAESEADKYKTVTLNSFRKSFRDKFLQQQNVPHNPAWFVEVEAPAEKDTERIRRESKENRPDFLVFGNENYRPESRSPVRERNERSSRPTTRSPVKRNETFRVERPSIEAHHEHAARAGLGAHTAQPSIRIEIKNSITPNLPGRIVPVGVAKPMPSQYTNHYYQQQQQQQQRTATAIPSITTTAKTTTRLNKDKSPLRGWSKSITVSPSRNHTNRSGRYQTLVQIRNDVNQAKSGQPSTTTTTTTLHTNNNTRGRLPTRIQLGGSPAMQKRLSTAGSRYSLASAPPSYSSAGTSAALSSYELFKQNSTAQNKAPPTTATTSTAQLFTTTKPTTKHTYFGDSHMHPTIATNNSGSAPRTLYGISNNAAVFNDSYAPPASKHQTQAQPPHSRIPSAIGGTVTGNGGLGGYSNRRDQYHQQQQQQQHLHRVVVPVQRRSRSPIKMPWR